MPATVGDELERNPAALIRAPAAAEILGVSERVLYQWAAASALPPSVVFRVGRAVYFRRAALFAWLGTTNGTGDGKG